MDLKRTYHINNKHMQISNEQEIKETPLAPRCAKRKHFNIDSDDELKNLVKDYVKNIINNVVNKQEVSGCITKEHINSAVENEYGITTIGFSNVNENVSKTEK
jgi:hypothetical protein